MISATLATLLFLLVIPPPTPPTSVSRWLLLGPVVDPLPVFHDEKPFGYGLDDLLKTDRFPHDAGPPEAAQSVAWPGGEKLTWRAVDAKGGELALPTPPPRDVPAVARLAVYVAVPRFATYDLAVLGSHPRRAWVDGEPVASGGADSVKAEVTSKVKLTRGKHLLIVETVLDPARKASWKIGARFTPTNDTSPSPKLSLDPARDIDLLDVLDAPQPKSAAVSPDGRHVAAEIERVVPGTDRAESWVEIRSMETGHLETTWRGGFSASGLAWRPDGRALSYFTTEEAGAAKSDEKGKKTLATIWITELDGSGAKALREHVENLESYSWSPDGSAIVYATSVEPEADSRGLKRVEGLLDRQKDYRQKTHLSLLDVTGGTVRRLTAGPITAGTVAFSNDGKRLLFKRSVEDLTERPFERTELWELDLANFAARKLRDARWLSDASYSPDGSRLLIRAGASEFGAVGRVLPDSVIPNEYDGELYIWDPATGAADAITRDFDPSVVSASWCSANGKIYVHAEERDCIHFFEYDPSSKTFTRREIGEDIVEDATYALRAPVAALIASSPWTPPSIVAVDLVTGGTRVLDRPAEASLEHVRRGRVEPWSFTASSGVEVDGRVYFPPDFEPAKKYPCIVYYYGGTGPVGREFGGRYPKEWWAAEGYVVYVLQPSGATGYGQLYSAQHVNDWGAKTSAEVIEGVKQFVATQSYVDPKRVGCIGASYGGFLTMLVVTQTDLFAAAVSHAGMSSLAAYWGEGYWGVWYSSVAGAESFPWNRRDLYVDQSPIFHADKVKTPILLTHGTADTNVPVGESDAFYTALKLVGAPVEYVQVEGLDHHIMDHAKRVVWSRSIVAWFDRWLKDQPEWWNELWPDRSAK